MIKYSHNNKLIEIIIDGNVAKEDHELIPDKLEKDIAKHGKVQVLEVIKNFEGFEPAIFWQDERFGMKYINDFSHLALVADSEWLQSLSESVGMFVATKVRTFELDDIESARLWLQNID